jgi:hypothetical protein
MATNSHFQARAVMAAGGHVTAAKQTQLSACSCELFNPGGSHDLLGRQLWPPTRGRWWAAQLLVVGGELCNPPALLHAAAAASACTGWWRCISHSHCTLLSTLLPTAVGCEGSAYRRAAAGLAGGAGRRQRAAVMALQPPYGALSGEPSMLYTRSNQ